MLAIREMTMIRMLALIALLPGAAAPDFRIVPV